MTTGANDPIGMLPAAGQWMKNPVQGYYPGQTVAGFNPLQNMGWNIGAQGYMQGHGAAQNNANWANGVADYITGQIQNGGGQANVNAGDIDQQYLNMLGAGDINGIQGNFQVNPYLNDQVNAFQDAFTRGFQRSLPSQSVDAMLAGQMGSSRHGIAEGLARSDFQQQLGEGTSNLIGNAWRDAAQNQLTSRGQTLQALAADRSRGTQAAMSQAGNRAQLEGINANNQTQMYSMAPNMINAMTNARMLPSQVMTQGGNWLAGVGGLHQGLAQNQINNEMARWNYNRDAGLNRLGQYSSLLTGSGAGQYGTNQQIVNQPGFLSQIAPILGATGAFMTGGASAGLFGSTAAAAGSDERLKENIQPVTGAIDKLLKMRGVTWDWKHDGKPSAGVIAQEVEKVLEDAVAQPGSYRIVDYTKVAALALEAIRELKQMIEEPSHVRTV